MNWTSVYSSNVNAVAYDTSTSTLYVRFNNGSEYAYPSANISLYNGMLSAPSVGQYHAAYVKHLPNYRL